MSKRYQVIIVGGGPVGVALAVELGQRGISCALVERHIAPQRIPKGQNLTQRTLEHFYFWGIVDELRAARLLPPGYPIGGITAYGNLMSDYWYAPPAREGVQSLLLPGQRAPAAVPDRRGAARGWPSFRASRPLRLDGRIGRAGRRRRARRDRRGRRRRARGPRGRLRGRLRRRPLAGAREPRHRPRRRRTSTSAWCWPSSARSELHEGLKRFPERTTYRVLKPELRATGSSSAASTWARACSSTRPVPADTTPDNYDFHGLLQEAAGFEFACEFDHVGFWDLRVVVASRYARAASSSPATPPTATRPTAASASTPASRTWPTWAGSWRAKLQGWGGDALLRLLRRGAAADLRARPARR